MHPIKSSLAKTTTRQSSIPHLKNVSFLLPNIPSNNNSNKINKTPMMYAHKLQNQYKNVIDIFPKNPIKHIKKLSIPKIEPLNKNRNLIILKPNFKYSSQNDDNDVTKQILLNNNVGIPELKEIQRHIQEKIYDMNEQIEIQNIKWKIRTVF